MKDAERSASTGGGKASSQLKDASFESEYGHAGWRPTEPFETVSWKGELGPFIIHRSPTACRSLLHAHSDVGVRDVTCCGFDHTRIVSTRRAFQLQSLQQVRDSGIRPAGFREPVLPRYSGTHCQTQTWPQYTTTLGCSWDSFGATTWTYASESEPPTHVATR